MALERRRGVRSSARFQTEGIARTCAIFFLMARTNRMADRFGKDADNCSRLNGCRELESHHPGRLRPVPVLLPSFAIPIW